MNDSGDEDALHLYYLINNLEGYFRQGPILPKEQIFNVYTIRYRIASDRNFVYLETFRKLLLAIENTEAEQIILYLISFDNSACIVFIEEGSYEYLGMYRSDIFDSKKEAASGIYEEKGYEYNSIKFRDGQI